jgi:hypothetical protein
MSTTFRKARSGRARSVATSGNKRYRAPHRRLSMGAIAALSRLPDGFHQVVFELPADVTAAVRCFGSPSRCGTLNVTFSSIGAVFLVRCGLVLFCLILSAWAGTTRSGNLPKLCRQYHASKTERSNDEGRASKFARPK